MHFLALLPLLLHLAASAPGSNQCGETPRRVCFGLDGGAAQNVDVDELLAVAAEHLKRVGGGLETAVSNYNKFVGSFERNVLTSGRRLADKGIEIGKQKLREFLENNETARQAIGVPAAVGGPSEGRRRQGSDVSLDSLDSRGKKKGADGAAADDI